MFRFGSHAIKSSRAVSVTLLAVLLLAGCGTTRPLDTFSLSTPKPSVSTPSRRKLQLLVPTPTALKALDSENIVVSSAPDSIAYLKGAQWGDRLTNIVQSRLVQAYENTGAFGGIGRPGDGLAINYQVLTDLRRFGIKAYASPQEHQDINDQVNTIEAWVTNKFDAVLVCTAGDFESMQNVYARAETAGTRVFQFNMPAELWDESQNRAISNIGYNNVMQAGYLAGRYIATKLGGKGKIILIWGLPGHWSTARRKGLDIALAEFPDLKIVGEQRGDYVRDKALNAAMNLLQRDPNINAIYGENEEMALGASQAIQALGLKPWDGTDGIITIGADGLKSGFESIKEGQMTATVSVGAVDQGRQSIETIFWNLIFDQVPPKVFNVRTQVVDKTNVDEPLAYVTWALSVPKI